MRLNEDDMRKRIPQLMAAALFLSIASSLWAAERGPVYTTMEPVEVLGKAPHVILAGVGEFNTFNKGSTRSKAARAELKIGSKLAFVGPAIGVIAIEDDGGYAYAGIYAELAWGRLLLTPLLAAGVYRQGNDLDLGGSLEFRESLEIAYRLSERWRAGGSIGHISNGAIYEHNPGQHDFFVTVAAAF